MTIPAHLCIARHGETDWNTLGILQGWIDVPLNQRSAILNLKRKNGESIWLKLAGPSIEAI